MTSISSQASTSILSSPLLSLLLSHPTIITGTPSVYILEQLVTLLNNLARETTLSGVALSHCVEFLLDLLLLARHKPVNTELCSATHRTVSKAVIGNDIISFHPSQTLHRCLSAYKKPEHRVGREDIPNSDCSLSVAN